MVILALVLLIVAAVCFAWAAANVATRPNLVALGLLCSVLAVLLPRLVALS